MDALDSFIARFRTYMETAPEQEIQDRWARVEALSPGTGPTLAQVLAEPCFRMTIASKSVVNDTAFNVVVMDDYAYPTECNFALAA